ncbi:HNH endonuclease, partial [Janthinobacterium agaricidamnosum]
IPFVKGLQATTPLPIALGMAVAEGMSDEAAAESAEQGLDAQGTDSGEGASSSSDDEKKQDVEKDPRRRFNKGERDRAQDRSKDADGDPACEYCGIKTTNKPGQANSAQTDHVDAWSKGGRTNDSNAANSCRTCNTSKGAKDIGTQWLPPGYR